MTCTTSKLPMATRQHGSASASSWTWGLSRADQCLVAGDALRKRQLAVAHFLLDRGLASSTEAAEYLPSFFMLVADWGDICVIKRLWKHTPRVTDSWRAFCFTLLRKSVVHGNREAAEFFVSNGAPPFCCLTSILAAQELRLQEDARLHFRAKAVTLRATLRGSSIEDFSDRLRAHKECAKARMVAAKYDISSYHAEILLSPLQSAALHGHVDILSDLLQDLDHADRDAINECGKICIPCVLHPTKSTKVRDILVKKGLRSLISGGHSPRE